MFKRQQLFLYLLLSLSIFSCQNEQEVPDISFLGPAETPALHPEISGKEGIAYGFANLYYQNWLDKVDELVSTFTLPESAEKVEQIDGNLPIQTEEIKYRVAYAYDRSNRDCKGLIQKTGITKGVYYEYFTSCDFFGTESGLFRKVWEGWQNDNRRFGYVQHYSTDIRSLDWEIRENQVVLKRLWPDGYQFTFNPIDLSGEVRVGGINSSTGQPYIRYISQWTAEGHGSYTLYNIDGSIGEQGTF